MTAYSGNRIDPDLVPGNIEDTIDIFGVVGTNSCAAAAMLGGKNPSRGNFLQVSGTFGGAGIGSIQTGPGGGGLFSIVDGGEFVSVYMMNNAGSNGRGKLIALRSDATTGNFIGTTGYPDNTVNSGNGYQTGTTSGGSPYPIGAGQAIDNGTTVRIRGSDGIDSWSVDFTKATKTFGNYILNNGSGASPQPNAGLPFPGTNIINQFFISNYGYPNIGHKLQNLGNPNTYSFISYFTLFP